MRTLMFSVLVAVLSVAGAAIGQSAAPSFSLTISLPQNPVKTGSHIRVDISKNNISNQDIDGSFRVGTAELSYNIIVKDENANFAAETSYGHKIHGRNDRGSTHSIVAGPLPPGKVLQEFFFVDQIYDVKRPGKYDIQVTQTDLVSKTLVKSNTVTVTVTP